MAKYNSEKEKERKRRFALVYMRRKRAKWKEDPKLCNHCGAELTQYELNNDLKNCQLCRKEGTQRKQTSRMKQRDEEL